MAQQRICRVDIACPSCSKGKPWQVLIDFNMNTRVFTCPACKKQYSEAQMQQMVAGPLHDCKLCRKPTTNQSGLCNVCELIKYQQTFQANQAWNAAHHMMHHATIYGRSYRYASAYTIFDDITDAELGLRQWAQCNECGELYNITGYKPGDVPIGTITCDCKGLFQVFKITKEESMTPVTNVRVWWDVNVKAYQMSSPYNADFVEALKSQIPWSDRSYNRETKVWTFVEKQYEPLMAFLSVLGVKPSVTTRAQAEATLTKDSSSTSRRPLELVALDFLRTVPHTAMLKAYRQASLDLHPDRNNGASDKFASLTALWDRIKKDVYNV